MKLFISIHEGNSNRFDYKVTYLLDQGFELTACNYTIDERNAISNASFIKEIEDGSDIEVERRSSILASIKNP